MTNRFEFKWSTKNAVLGDAFMGWLKAMNVDFDVELADFTAKKENYEYVFKIHANRMNVCEVMRYLDEEL